MSYFVLVTTAARDGKPGAPRAPSTEALSLRARNNAMQLNVGLAPNFQAAMADSLWPSADGHGIQTLRRHPLPRCTTGNQSQDLIRVRLDTRQAQSGPQQIGASH